MGHYTHIKELHFLKMCITQRTNGCCILFLCCFVCLIMCIIFCELWMISNRYLLTSCTKKVTDYTIWYICKFSDYLSPLKNRFLIPSKLAVLRQKWQFYKYFWYFHTLQKVAHMKVQGLLILIIDWATFYVWLFLKNWGRQTIICIDL